MRVGGEGNSKALDFDLNLAPVIDCFTVLIAFVLISAAYASIGIFDAGVAAGGESAASATPPPIQVTVELKADHSFRVKVTGKINQEIPFAAVTNGSEATWNLVALNQKLSELKTQWSGFSSLVLSAENTVPYKDIILSMESIRKTVPSILLGGF